MKATKQGMKCFECCLFVSVLINLFDANNILKIYTTYQSYLLITLFSFWIPQFFLL